LAACASPERPPPSPPHVVVIVADTLRADRLGVYGCTLGLTPFLDSYAARGVVFQRAYTASPWTLPSVATLFTSRFPSQHGVVAHDSVLPESELTLAEVLRTRGYATAAFSANGLMRPQGGLGQGFDVFDILGPYGSAGKVTGDLVNKVALAWVDGLRRGAGRIPPIFLYVHYMDPHLPYLPSADALERVLAGRPRPDLAALNALTPVLPVQPNLDQMLPDLWDGYNASVASLDNAIVSLLTELDRRDIFDNAVVVFTADHGEEFREHGRFGHGEDLYNEVVHVPLLLLRPERAVRLDVAEVISLVDVAPTILAHLRIASPAAFVGTPWTAPAHGAARAPHPAFIELIPTSGKDVSPARAVVEGSHKRIVADDGTTQSFDLSVDPGERHPDGLDADEERLLDRALAEFRDRMARTSAPRAVEPLDDDTKARLRALGYVH
jgi:arylsulfatase A-like enzyme